MNESVHKGIVQLIYHTLCHIDPDTAERHYAIALRLDEPSELSPIGDKITLLEYAYEKFGIDIFDTISRQLSRQVDSPLLFFLLNSKTPDQLLGKLQSFDRYFHSTRTLVQLDADEKQLIVEHRTRDGGRPHLLEDVFVFFILKTMFETIGCQGLHGCWLESMQRPREISIDDIPAANPGLDRTLFKFDWERIHHANAIPGLDNFLLSTFLPRTQACAPRQSNIRLKVEEIISANLLRRWSIADIASELNLSSRSLQRRLKDEDTSFSRILLEVRVDKARCLLSESDYAITDIGLLCGFSDGAHFSRDFKRLTGSSPRAFRTCLATNS